jgi:Bifunctional DNA primase/polymerase, N-terminal
MNNRIVEYRNACIAEYLESGYTLFPCSQNKKPILKGWNKLTFNPQFYINSAKAFGVLLGQLDMVLDYDNRRDDIYLGQLKKFLKLLGYESPLKTLIVSTARKGLHVYLKIPHKSNAAFYVPNFPAIEVKRHGQYVIGGGSVINGVQYKIVRR